MAEPTNWAIIDDATNIVVNVCVWDGVEPWTPPAGTYVVNLAGRDGWIGWEYHKATDTFTPPPTISNASPDTASKAGGTTITLTGVGFAEATSATINGTAVAGLSVISDTEMTIITPAFSRAFSVQIFVSTPLQTGGPFSITITD